VWHFEPQITQIVANIKEAPEIKRIKPTLNPFGVKRIRAAKPGFLL